MSDFLDLFEGFRYKLLNISYNFRENGIDEEKPVTYIDSYDNVCSDEQAISIDFHRNLSVNKGILFDLSVSYRIEHIFNEDADINIEDIDIDNEIKDNIAFFSGNIMSYVSVLISEITTSFGRYPVITAPVVKLKDSK